MVRRVRKNVKTLALSIFILLGTFVHQAEAKVQQFKESGLQFDVPTSWSVKEKDNTLMLMPKDESIFVIIKLSESKKETDFKAEIKASLDSVIKEIPIQKAKTEKEYGQDKANDLNMIYLKGKGLVDGKGVVYSAAIFMSTEPVLIFFVADEIYMKSGKNLEFQEFAKSISAADDEEDE